MDDFDDEGDGRGSGSSDHEEDDDGDDFRNMEDVEYNKQQEDYANGAEEENDDENDNEDDEDESQDQDNSRQRYQSTVGRNNSRASVNASSRPNGYSHANVMNGPVLAPPTSQPRSYEPTSSMEHRDQLDGPSDALPFVPQMRPEAITANVYDIVPTIAAPHSTSINAITATPDLRFVFSGGSDGYIRKFNWVETANGKLMLTVAQRHPFVDSVTKAGVLVSYWENEEPNAKPGEDQTLSSVYSLACHSQGLWLLSGLESGGINLQTVRHEEGKRITCLKQHTSAVSVLNLAQDERSVLSGSWDKTILNWDLNSGQVTRTFGSSSGQISAIEMRPLSTLPVPEISQDAIIPNGTMANNNAEKPKVNGVSSEADPKPSNPAAESSDPFSSTADAPGSPADSLFGGNDGDSLFGDNDDDAANPSSRAFGDDEDDEFSRAIANGMPHQDDTEGETASTNATTSGPQVNGISNASSALAASTTTIASAPSNSLDPAPLTNGFSRSSVSENQPPSETDNSTTTSTAPPPASSFPATADTTFLAASFDGTLQVWDKRQPTPIAKIAPLNAPPWCMGACWSPDGNFIYAGRRNGTVEEYSLHKGLRGVERSFRFPNGSGPVSAVRTMPNGRHLICASYDILRLYDLQQQQTFKHSSVPFLIVPGHRTGVVSQLYLDPTCRYMISTAGNRGWEGSSTEVLLGYEIGTGV